MVKKGASMWAQALFATRRKWTHLALMAGQYSVYLPKKNTKLTKEMVYLSADSHPSK